MNLKKVPLHDLHVQLGAKMIPFAGYEMPVRYSSDKEEHLVVPDVHDKAGRTEPVDKPGTYFLQAGSFRSYGEADTLKARLALLGVESKIDTVTVNNSDTWHRVRVGPYQDLRKLNKIRTRLLNHNINAILLKIKG